MARPVVTLLIFLTLASAELAEAKQTRPNIVLILADDLGYGELGCYGGREIPTPHIDELAAQGTRFTSGYVTAPYCAASRAGLLTGRYQTRFGFEFNPIGAANAEWDTGLPLTETTFADVLRDNGYATALVGKWHLGATARFHPYRRGFDEFFGFLHEGHFYVPPPWHSATTWLRRKALPDGSQGRWISPDGKIIWSTHMGYREPDYNANNPLLRGSQPVTENENLTDAFAREAVSFIERHRAQPFFLYLAYNAVHSPLQADDRYLQRYEHIEDIQRRIFAAMLGHLDESVGRVLAALEQQGVSDNTLVVFLSDNGGPTRELTSSNAPLRGGKGQFYEGGIRIPMIMKWPGRFPAGKSEHRAVISLDIAPTVLGAAHVEHRKGQNPLDGVDLLATLSTNPSVPVHETYFWRMGESGALRRGDWKIVRHRRRSQSDWELYRLAEDLSEAVDLAGEQPNVLDDLVSAWESFSAGMVRPARSEK
ncbi:MAG: sulfatase [Planctomycetales bacterium]|nr:sulfatase [Planctomycetales bacterium]